MNNNTLKIAGITLLGLYAYNRLKDSGLSPDLQNALGKANQLIDQNAHLIQNPVVREKAKKTMKMLARNHLMNHAGVRDVTPLNGGTDG